MDKENYIVRVSCLTFNHSLYITDALNGFVMQQTNFPFVCTIIDDASTDGEQDKIRKFLDDNFDLNDISVAYDKDTDYGHITYARHKTNKNCFFVVIFLKDNHYSIRKSKVRYISEWTNTKYIALCEGDDYWIDPFKLQKQVDFLEKHGDFVLVYHNSVVEQDDKKNLFLGLNYDSHIVNINELLNKWSIPTASILYRNNNDILPKDYPGFINGDYALELLLFRKGYFYYMSSIMSVYRKHSESVSAGLNSNKIKMYQNLIDLLSYMKNLYEVKDRCLFDVAIEKYQLMMKMEQKNIKYPFLKYFDWRFYKRLIFKKFKLTRTI